MTEEPKGNTTEEPKGNTTEEPKDSSTEDAKGKGRRLLEDMEEVFGEVNSVVRKAVIRGSDAVEFVGENVMDTIKDTFDGVRSARKSVVMVRVDEQSLARLDELVEVGLSGSRSEAAAYLISEGVKAKRGTFDKIEQKIEDIRRAKQELRDLLREDVPADKSAGG